jgi:2-dehydro-3-deoxygalactonokinase
VMHFQTALSGELFELLRKHSVLARDSGAVDAAGDAFGCGTDFARQNREADLLHLLFSARSRVVTGEMAKADAASYLSGLVVGKDVATAHAVFGLKGRVHLVCTPQLAALYGRALAQYDLQSAVIDGDAAALAGLAHIQAELP